MMLRRFTFILFVTVLMAAYSGWQSPTPGKPAAATEDSVGTATMRTDGTVVLYLRADARGFGAGQVEYPKGDPLYDELLKRTGGLAPGESKVVPERR